MTAAPDNPAHGPNAVHDLVDTDRELALLRELIQAASSGPGVEPLAAAAARMITAATGTDVCFVHVLDDSDRSLTLAGATPPFDASVGKIRLPLGSGISGWVAKHREPVVITDDKEADPRYLPIQSLRGRDFTSMVSMPMETDPGGLVGVLNVHTVARREFTDGDVELLRVIGRLIAGAMHQARLHRQLVARERAHELFVEQVIEAQEIERRRVAGDIHDGISQRLITLSYRLDAAARAVGTDPDEASSQLAEARAMVGLTLDEARAAISGLRPPVLDDLGLAGGLASLARSIPQLDTELDLADVRLPEHIEIALYRIAQEGLQNIVKHANASVARLRFAVDADDIARLEIVDNGIGFDTFEHPLGSDEMGGYGVLSMAERAELVGGTLNIRSRPGSGTAVTATIPVPSLDRLEVAGVAPQGLDRRHQRLGLALRDADVGEHLLVERDGGVLDGRAAQVGDLHQRGSAVGRVRHALHQLVGFQPADRVGDAGDVHLQPVGCLGDRQRPAAAECQQSQQLEPGKAQIVRPQRIFDAGQQDLVGPHHRRDRDHSFGDVAPAGAFPIRARDSDGVAVVGFAAVMEGATPFSYQERAVYIPLHSPRPATFPPQSPPPTSMEVRRR